jgi:hypothetical protein
MESLFLINPRKRKRRKGRMPPALAAYWAKKRGGGKKRRKVRVKTRMTNPRRRRRNPKRRRARARRRNPVYHRRRRKVYASRRRRKNPIRAHRRVRHRRRNPFGQGEIKSVIVPGLIGAGGAIALAVAYGFATPYLPTSMTSGFFPTIIQAAGALGIGFLAGKFLGRSAGNAAAVGALTVIAVNQITPLISSATSGAVPGMSGFGGLKLGGVGDYVPYRKAIGAYMPGKVMPTGRRGAGMGFISPAPKIGAYMKRRGVGAYMPKAMPMRGFGAADMSGGSGYNGLHDGM